MDHFSLVSTRILGTTFELKVVHFDWFYSSDQMPVPFAKLQKQAKKSMQVKVGFATSDESQVGY